MDQHRNPRYWEQIKPKEWLFKGRSTLENNLTEPNSLINDHFQENSNIEYNKGSEYITIGKGWPC